MEFFEIDVSLLGDNIGFCYFSLSTDVLFSQKIVERANENNKPRDMTANANVCGQTIVI